MLEEDRDLQTTKNYGHITSKSNKVVIGFCSICQRKKSMTVSDNTIQAEKLGEFFKNLGRKYLIYHERWQKTF